MTEQTTYKRVAKWNERCDKSPAETGTTEYWESLINQADRIQEELNELYQAIECTDPVEAFDALLDLDVVVSGGLYLSNGDYAGGIDAVLNNNDLKYTRSEEAVVIAAHSWLNAGTKVEVRCVAECSEDGWEDPWTNYSVHRVSDDKVLKFPGHPKVDLEPFAPKVGER